MALSAAVIGYAVPAIDEAVIRQIKKGFVFSVPSLLEAELAERLCERFPSVECVRFLQGWFGRDKRSSPDCQTGNWQIKIVTALPWSA